MRILTTKYQQSGTADRPALEKGYTMSNLDHVKIAMVNANESLVTACNRYENHAHRGAMYSALDALKQYTDAVADFSNDYPYSESIWRELRKVSEYVERLKWDYVE